MIITELF